MAIDPSISLNAKAPNPVTGIADMVNLARGIQGYKTGQIQQESQGINLAQQQEKNQEFQAINSAKSQWLNPDGSINMEKASQVIPQIAPQTGPAYLQNLAVMDQAHTAASQAKLNMNNDERSTLGAFYSSLGYAGVNQPQQVSAALTALKNQYKDSPAMQQYVDAAQVGLQQLPAGPMLPRLLIQQGQQLLTPAQQQAQLAPQPGTLNTGGAVVSTVTQPSVAGAPPSVRESGMVAPLTLPPTATTVSPTGQPTYVGAGPQGQTVPAGLSPLQIQNQHFVAQDWASTQQLANAAQQDIPVLDTIKQYTQGAITNTGSAQRTLAAGLLSLVGISPADAAKTNTDILAKNSNMLALAGGDTNLAKQLAEVANPNIHMTKEAIQTTANEVLGMKDMALFKQQYMRQFANDPDSYQKNLADFDKNADFRVFMLPNMSVKARADLLRSMSPAELKQFKAKAQWMDEQGAQ